MAPAIIVHGGAWDIPDQLEAESRAGVIAAARAGYAVLSAGGTAVDAVEAAVAVLEELPAFDAGVGSVLNADGKVEVDAMIMEGSDLGVGAVAAVPGIKHPVKLARELLREGQHTMMVGAGARAYATERGFPIATVDELVTPEAKAEWEKYRASEYKKPVQDLFNGDGHDTVGAAAVDASGCVASATSTGGITMKRPGRVGDSPLPACGGYADNEFGAASTTGHGESLTKVAAAFRAVTAIPNNSDPAVAATTVLDEMRRRVGGRGGIILVTPDGRVGESCTTNKMVWASICGETTDRDSTVSAMHGFHRGERTVFKYV